VACIASLRGEGIEPVLFWYNPNIHPYTEYSGRRDTLVKYAGDLGLELVVEDQYGLRSFIAGLCRGLNEDSGRSEGGPNDSRDGNRGPNDGLSRDSGLGPSPERYPGGPDREPGPEMFGKDTGNRCAYCYRIRLARTAALARERGFDAFSTTLLISPYQNHELLVQTAQDAAEEYGVEFLYRDFRPRFREGQAEARRLGLYMQKYCGCIFSEEERYTG
jgi:predicted adenine nucleotide alpha hydrolase (AANH) superfamily ATPase